MTQKFCRIQIQIAGMLKQVVILCMAIALCFANSPSQCQPFGIRISLGNYYLFSEPRADDKIIIQFNTRGLCNQSYIMVQAIISQTDLPAPYDPVLCRAEELKFSQYVTYIQTCVLSSLKEGEKVFYTAVGWAGLPFASFPASIQHIPIKVPKYEDPNSEFKMIVLADWGPLDSMQSRYEPLSTSFQKLIDEGAPMDAIYIGGDVAYDLDTNSGRNYERFLLLLEQAACRWFLVFNPGNHEHVTADDELILRKSFNVYTQLEKRVSILDLPWVDLVMFDPYKLLYKGESDQQLFETFREEVWKLKNKRANSNSANQRRKPAIAASHYPLACNGPDKDCVKIWPVLSRFFIEMIESNMPIYIGGHYHAYQRFYPLSSSGKYLKTNKTQYHWSSTQQQFDNWIISIVEGVAGNDHPMAANYTELKQGYLKYLYDQTGYGVMSANHHRLQYSHYANMREFDSFSILIEGKERFGGNLRVSSE